VKARRPHVLPVAEDVLVQQREGGVVKGNVRSGDRERGDGAAEARDVHKLVVRVVLRVQVPLVQQLAARRAHVTVDPLVVLLLDVKPVSSPTLRRAEGSSG